MMSFDAGGHADKLGNRYEGRWVVKQLLFLLNEQLRSVTVEAIGDDEAGVDLWVGKRDQTREAQQCKANNRSKSQWTMADLGHSGVLKHIRSQLARDKSYEFSFVSSVPAPLLSELCDRARELAESPQAFIKHHINEGTSARRGAFDAYCKRLDLDVSSEVDRTIAVDLLGRTHVHQFADDRHAKEDLCGFAKLLVVADPDLVIACLADYVDGNLRKTIITNDLRSHLRSKGFQLRRLVGDDRLASMFENLRCDFIESIQPTLAGDQLISRLEADALCSLVTSDSSPSVTLLHGGTGSGKSGVLYALARRLDETGVPYVAIRLDRKPPRGTAVDWAQSLGLPDTPPLCLAELAGDRQAVLILDQLDALRWTNSHAPEGIDVCKSLLREVRALREAGRRITAVVSCRTFDMRHDPQIKEWLGAGTSPSVTQIEVGCLPSDVVKRIVEKFGLDSSRFPTSRLTLLSCVQNLAMWIQIVRLEQKSPDFDSATQLMRAFWKSRNQHLEAAGISPDEREKVLASLVDHMERTASLEAPSHLLESHQKLATELQSLGVVSITGKTVSFGHQSYLDFQIADRIIRTAGFTPASLLDWLGDKTKQPLFRREQLRQVLFLLAADDPHNFCAVVHRLLKSDRVRFHIKQLALEAIGQLRPEQLISDLAIQLLNDDKWRDHVLGHVFAGNAAYVDALSNRGILRAWLLSGDSVLENRALWLLELVAGQCEDALANCCEAVIELGGDWPLRVRNVLLRSSIATESKRLFRVRLHVIRLGALSEYVPWDALARDAPSRALRLLGAMYESFPDRIRGDSNWRSYLRFDQPEHVSALMAAGRKRPRLAWSVLLPNLFQLIELKREQRRAWKQGKDQFSNLPLFKVPRALVRILMSTARALARQHPSILETIVNSHSASRSATIQRILVAGKSALPNSEADQAVDWLISNQRRLRCGSGRKHPSWEPARLLIERMSPHCSAQTFRRLEHCLLRYRDPCEAREAAYWLEARRRGDFRGQFGAAQYHLLSALPLERCSLETRSRFGVLQRNFESVAPRPRARGWGGPVRSPIGSHRLDHLSDKAWLAIIDNKDISARRGRWKHSASGLLETSVEAFARDLRTAALRDPERFVRLGRQIPPGTAPAYLASVLEAARRTRSPDEVPQEKREMWEPASKAAVEGLLDRVPLDAEPQLAQGFCSILIERDDVTCSDAILTRLLTYAGATDPAPHVLHVYCNHRADKCSIHELEANAINCVRGVSAYALARVISSEPALLPIVRPTLEALIADDHPAVRVAAIQLCRPMWTIDPATAVQWLVNACEKDERVGACHDARDLYNAAFPGHSDKLEPLIRRMVRSSDSETANVGAIQVAARHIFFGLFSDDLEECCAGSVSQRKGVAHVAAELVAAPQHSAKARALAVKFFDDSDKEVREELGRISRSDEILRQAGNEQFLCDYVKSAAFREEPRRLLHTLGQYTGRLTDLANLIHTMAVELAIERSRDPADPVFYAANEFSSILLRLYEEANGPERVDLRDTCLDLWDLLLERRIGAALNLTQEIAQ
jgi:hypothetical protein